jgi:hypothetical protein
MAGTVRDWRIAMLEAHPNLFHPPEAHPETADGYPSCGEGWRDLLERACVRIEAALADGGGTFRASQIKEKFGGLRFYWWGQVSPETAARISDALALAEARSFCSCETCGAEGQLYRHGGISMTRCAAHAKGQPVPAKPGRENVHMVRVAAPQGFRVAPRRYDRATDSFIDVPPASPEIEE